MKFDKDVGGGGQCEDTFDKEQNCKFALTEEKLLLLL